MTERVEGSDWLRPSAYRAGRTEDGEAVGGDTPGGGRPAPRTRAETRSRSARTSPAERTRRPAIGPVAPGGPHDAARPAPRRRRSRRPRTRRPPSRCPRSPSRPARAPNAATGPAAGAAAGEAAAVGAEAAAATTTTTTGRATTATARAKPTGTGTGGVAIVLTVLLLPFVVAIVWFVMQHLAARAARRSRPSRPARKRARSPCSSGPGSPSPRSRTVVAALPGHSAASFASTADVGQGPARATSRRGRTRSRGSSTPTRTSS